MVETITTQRNNECTLVAVIMTVVFNVCVDVCVLRDSRVFTQ
jgi:hypothetical protein